MVIVRIQGGLANQMFQYTFYYWLRQKHKEMNLDIDTFCDTSMYYHSIPKQEADPYHNGYELENVFGIKANIAELNDVYKLSQYRYDTISKVIMKLRVKAFGFPPTLKVDDEKGIYDPQLAFLDNKYFSGTWGGFKYAEEYEDQIRDIFTFSEINDDNNREILNHIKDNNSVSVHIRRGDYLRVGGGITLDKSYWDGAMRKIREDVENPVFFFFSDDIAWCKENFNGNDIVFVDWNTGRESYRDMQLMSMCKHNIVANSTFSMWASWLNTNKDKIVITPGIGIIKRG